MEKGNYIAAIVVAAVSVLVIITISVGYKRKVDENTNLMNEIRLHKSDKMGLQTNQQEIARLERKQKYASSEKERKIEGSEKELTHLWAR